MSDVLSECVSECCIIDNHLYLDHVPLTITFDIKVDHAKTTIRTFRKKAAWFKANEDDIFTYRQRLNDKLSNIDLNLQALCCKDIFCVDHKDTICDFYNKIIDACLYAVPSWNDHVEHLKQNALEWQWYWKQNGCPHHGDISEMRRITRVRYHRASRHTIKMQKMAESLLDNRSRDMWA